MFLNLVNIILFKSRHEISWNPSADRFSGQIFPLTGNTILITRSVQFPQNFRSQCPRVRALSHIWSSILVFIQCDGCNSLPRIRKLSGTWNIISDYLNIKLRRAIKFIIFTDGTRYRRSDSQLVCLLVCLLACLLDCFAKLSYWSSESGASLWLVEALTRQQLGSTIFGR